MKSLFLLLPCAVIGLGGCGAAADDDLPGVVETPKAEVVAFEGNVDPSMTGTWVSIDKKSTLILNADGAARMKSDVATHGQSFAGDIPGKWKSGGGELLFQQDNGDVMRFYTTMKGKDTMEARRVKGSAIVIVYKRQA